MKVTDLPEFVPLMQYNIEKNQALIDEKGGLCEAEELSWGTNSNRKADVILLADCIYYEQVSICDRIEHCSQQYKCIKNLIE